MNESSISGTYESLRAMVFFSKVWLRLGLAHPLGISYDSGPLVPGSPGPLVVVPWSPGCLVLWSPGPGPLVLWSPGPLVPWSPGPLVPGPLVPWSWSWSSGPLVLWSIDPLVFGCGFLKDRNTANYSLWSF